MRPRKAGKPKSQEARSARQAARPLESRLRHIGSPEKERIADHRAKDPDAAVEKERGDVASRPKAGHKTRAAALIARTISGMLEDMNRITRAGWVFTSACQREWMIRSAT